MMARFSSERTTPQESDLSSDTPIQIGSHRLRNSVWLAPMAGVTDAPFRQLAWRFGAGHVVGEMVSAKAELWHTRKSSLRRRSVEGISPVAVQIAGGDPEIIADAARRHWHDGADIVDINFGCPAKKVCRKAAGSALLADEPLVAGIIAAAVAAVPIPITVKIRSGYSPEQRNGLAIARIAESEGAQAVVVHGRTRACRFSGDAEFDTVAAIKQAVKIPVIANGDIADAQQMARVMEHTGVDAVMIGRAALGAPWLLGQLAGVTGELMLDEKIATMLEHLNIGHEFYGEAGVRIMRKHLMWYLEKLDELGSSEQRRSLIRSFNALTAAQAQLDFVENLAAAASADVAA
jgi:tRNA-dihydrouridine synthase B